MMLAIPFVFVLVLTVLAVIDFRRSVIPNKIVYPAILATILIDILSPARSVLLGLVAGILLAGFLAAAGLLQKKMGMGDVKLAFLIGLMTGLPAGLIAVVSGVILGGLAAIFLLAIKAKGRNDEMPYGPYLAAGAIIAMLFSVQIEGYVRGIITSHL